MKTTKIILTSLMLFLAGVMAYGQGEKIKKNPLFSIYDRDNVTNYLDLKSASVSDTILNESFEGDFSGWIYYNNDEDDYYWGFYEEDSETDCARTGSYGLGVYYNESIQNDDWLLTPKFGLPADAAKVTFSFWARAISAEYPEDFNVLLSNSTDEMSSFEYTLDNVTSHSSEWTEFSYDLTSYAGDSIFIAIQYVSDNQYALFVDDFLMVAEQNETDDWSEQHITLYNTAEADLMARTGDVDNLGFGWPEDFDPFSGESTPSHNFPWEPGPDDAPGTDRIIVGSGYDENSSVTTDGYTRETSRPDNYPEAITVSYDLQGVTINSAVLQIFVDDFQAEHWGADYQVTIDGVRAPFFENIINSLSQGGPIGKMISVNIPDNYLQYFADGEVSILIDDPVTGAGDGYAIDFVKLLINPGSFSYTGTITGVVQNSETNEPIAGANVAASGIIEGSTGTDGVFTLNNVPAGINYVEISADGFITHSVNVDLLSGDTENITVELTPIVDVPEILSVEYGPPAQTDTWTIYNIPLNAETFGVDDVTFEQAMQQIEMIRIRTEMHTGDDEGGVDQVVMGNFSSDFNSGSEGWSALGDGTIKWNSSGGFDGGYISISDWATGEWHWAVAPESWSGDLRSLIGQDLSFYFMTDEPSYEAYIEFHTSSTNRIVLSSGEESVIAGNTIPLDISLVPQPENEITVSLSSSNTSALTVPNEATIDAYGNATVNLTASNEVEEQTTCVVTVNAPGYSKSRITITVNPRPEAIISTSEGGYWNEPSTWIGGVVPTESDDVVIDGTVVIYSRADHGSAANLTINENDTLKGDSSDGIFDAGVVFVYIHGNLANKGVITDGNSMFNIDAHGDVHNEGIINCSRLYFSGDTVQDVSMNSAATFKDMGVVERDIQSPVRLASDLTFQNSTIELREFQNQGYEPGTMTIPEGTGYSLILDKCKMLYTNLEGNGNSIVGGNSSSFYEMNTLYDVQLKGSFDVKESITFAGDSVVLLDTLNGNYRYDTIYAESKLIHYGYMPYNSPAVVILEDFVNAGDWYSDHTYIAGTSDQKIVFKEHAVHHNKRGIILQADLNGATSFQWTKDGKDLHEATENNLELENLDNHNNGIYTCMTDAGTSRNITLDISYPGLVAGFTAEATTGTAPFTSQFTSQSEGNPDNWKWEIALDNEEGRTEYGENPEITFYNPGVYDITLIVYRDEKADTLTMEDYIVVEEETGLDSYKSDLLKIYPNPVEDYLHLNFSEPVDENVKLEITDITGKIMMRDRLSSGKGMYVLNVSQFKKGIYYVKVENSKNVVFQKIIKK